MEFSFVKYFLIMVAMALCDVFWTLYFIHIEERRAHPASLWSAMIILVTAFTVTNYVENMIYISAAFVGAYLGTLLTIKWKLRQERELSLMKKDSEVLKQE